MFGFTAYYDSLNAFYAQFVEIFIHHSYYFESKTERPLIVDCGANIGMSSLYFKYLYPGSVIKCFEPSPDSFITLRRNMDRNKISNVQIHNKAVGNKTGDVDFYFSTKCKSCTGNSTNKTKVNLAKHKKIKTGMVKLSSFKFDIDYLKLDIEGGEGEVIKDLAEHNLLEKIKIINLEYHPCENNSLSEILARLEKARFHYVIKPSPIGKTLLIECVRQNN
ncbi:FkbM family methyltransferase [Candidatus Woesearchaeota archaeon]|nr:FkbM family methyltransferase [Candidatus Woesearchaeota archaeon]MBT3538450.1 FkbM family methyltransferase [Candidatus Woesearchaeota archaeon]MBT4697013.1 FkbM family methyltransferase [Candidatus Woesearchaeota archaeon]MBT7106094.1 FkbM family methyltransferase [Candidatus Woesearchaeota archaeon]MBT7931008.1 FkbM family methyltransferase [Candidatus Woesearchaeota archaeon]